MLEDVAVYNVEVDIPYEPWYDNHARVFDIGPGQMLNWELNAPHRVENLDTFSVSMTVSYTNDTIRRAEIVNLANGLLRHRFGYQPKSRNLRGPSFFAKAVLQKLMRDSGWVKRERKARRADRFPARRRAARQDRRSAEGGLSRWTGNDGIDGRSGTIWARGKFPARPDFASSLSVTGSRPRRGGMMPAPRRRSRTRVGLTHGTMHLPASMMSSR